jgi:hypothetical protein
MPPVTSHPRTKQRVLGIVCVCILAVTAVAGLRPFDPSPKNNVTWLPDRDGLRFGALGIALSSSPLVWPTTSSKSSTFSLEISLRPDNNDRTNNILTFYTSEAPQRFRLIQSSDSTILFYRDFRNEHREMEIEETLPPGIPVLIAITAGPRGTAVYLNGVLKRRSTRLQLSRADLSGQIVLGTSPLAAETWSGDIQAIALYAAELTPEQVSNHFDARSRGDLSTPPPDEALVALYSFSERAGNVARDRLGQAPDLSIPASFQVPHKRFLTPPSRVFASSRSFLRDLVINVAGFIVLGFFFCLYRAATGSGAKSAALFAIAVGASISLSIETLQMFLPTRTSSIVDLAANTLGAVVGAFLCATIQPHRPRGIDTTI